MSRRGHTHKKKCWFFGALAAAVAAFFYHRGDKATGIIGGLTASLGAFTVNEWGGVVGIILGSASFILTWIYKQKYLEAIRKGGTKTFLKEGVEP